MRTWRRRSCMLIPSPETRCCTCTCTPHTRYHSESTRCCTTRTWRYCPSGNRSPWRQFLRSMCMSELGPDQLRRGRGSTSTRATSMCAAPPFLPTARLSSSSGSAAPLPPSRPFPPPPFTRKKNRARARDRPLQKGVRPAGSGPPIGYFVFLPFPSIKRRRTTLQLSKLR